MEQGYVASDELVESRALTGLRGVGAALVMSHHLYLRIGLDQHLPMVQWVLRKGYLGVDLFFVLSGFIMSMVYGSWFGGPAHGSGVAYLRFIVRRVARLWPMHVVVVLAVLGQGWLQDLPGFGARVIAENVAMVQAWGHSTEINPPAWSISTEFLAYLFFPLLAMLALRGTWRPVFCMVGVALALGVCMYYSPPIGLVRRGRLDLYLNYSVLPSLRCLSGFVIGMLAWRLGQLGPVRRLMGLDWVGPVFLVGMLAMMLGRVNDLLTLMVMPLVVMGFHFGRGPVHRAFGRSPMHELGVLSYAIYLVHFMLLTLFPFDYGPLRFMLPAYVAVTVLLAVAMHYGIERPGRRLIRGTGEGVLSSLWPRAASPVLERPLRDRAP